MKEQALKEILEARFAGVEAYVQREQRVIVSVPQETLSSVLMFLRTEGYHQLALVACVDWIEEGKFELSYHVASFETRIHVIVKIFIERDKPVVLSVVPLYENAQPYEREIHEFFGVDFTGNDDLSPLYLDNWTDLPPMRKDFDTKAYSERTYDYE